MMTDIVISGLCKSYGDTQVLSGFSTTFPHGQITAIMGASGCGKTTLLNILLGLQKSDSGNITGLPDTAAAVFQENRLCEMFTPLTNLTMACPTLTKKQAADHLAGLGLGETLSRPVAQLSGGQKRRVAIARALLSDGELLVLDEPFKGLDATTLAIVSDYMRDNRRGRTTLIVTHNEEELKGLGENILKM